MRFTVLLAITFAAMAVALPHEDKGLEKRHSVTCRTHQDCVDYNCGHDSQCRGINHGGVYGNVCVTILGRGGQGEVFSICDTVLPVRPPAKTTKAAGHH
jgi:hypothetical protein